MVPHLNCDAAPVEDRWNSPVSSVLHPLNSSLNTLKTRSMKPHPIRALGISAFLAIFLSVITASAQLVIVSEIMYNPSGDAPEYIEIQNTTSTAYDIALWEITGGINFTFPDFDASDPQAHFLKNKERILVSSVAPDALRAAYDIPANVRVYGPWDGDLAEDGTRSSGFLSNQGESLTVKDKNGSLFGSVSYSDDFRWGVAADGAGHSLHVINRFVDASNFRNWQVSVNAGGSPGVDEPNNTHPDIHLSEVWFDADGKLAWVELYNAGASAANVDGTTIRTQADLTGLAAEDLEKVNAAISGSVPAGGYLAVDVNLEADDDTGLFLADTFGNVLSAHRFSDATVETSYQVFPAASGEWYGTAAATQGAANAPVTSTAVVINEIMFDPIGGSHGEFIELYNKSDTMVELGGWELQTAVSFVFPSGTQLGPDSHMVVASDLEWFKSIYGADVNAHGDFDGVLSNGGDLIRLIDSNGNLADEVDYGVGGEWPTLANDLGASMELLHPDMDNAHASAWRDSDESSKSELREYSIKKEYSRNGTFQPGGVGRDQELHFHLVGDGYLLLEDIDLHRPKSLFNPNAANIIENVDKQSNSGSSSDGWYIQGTHAQSYVDGNQLHLISDGRGDNRANRVEIDIEDLGNSTDLELTFKARWLYGKSRLIAQTVDHGWSHEFLIDVPEDIGTPGAPNTAASNSTAPQADDLLHSPAVPDDSQNVTITARVSSVTPLKTVQVRYTKDRSGGNAESLFNQWKQTPMNDSGTGGDAVAGDGIYSAQITDLKEDGNVVVFYVNVIDENDAFYNLPKYGIDRPAIYVVDNNRLESDLRVQRVVMSEYYLDQFGDRPQAKFDYKYPFVSNHYKPCTVIMDEEHIIYNCEARSAGSPWHEGERPNLGLKGKYKTPRSKTFRGRVKSTWDQDPTSGDRQHNDKMTQYWMYLLGHPASDTEFIQVIINAGNPAVRAEVEAPSDNGFMDRHWKDGSQGQMFRIDDEWTFPDNFSSKPNRNAEWTHKSPNGDRGGRYHSEWMLRSREAEYDFDPIMSLFKMTTDGDFTQAQAERMIHTEQMAINMAVRGYIGDWDTFSIRRGKNGFMYRRSTDGKFQFIHWDSDLAFQGTGEAFLNGAGNPAAFRNWHVKPYVRRLYNYYLNEMLEEYTNDSKRMEAFFVAEEESSDEYPMRDGKYKTWFSGRKNRTRSEIGSENTGAAFAITTEGGDDFSMAEDFLTLEGTAGADVYNVILKDYPEHYPEPKLEWLSEIGWRLSGIVLAEGENSLAIRATDRAGKELGSLFSPRADEINVTKTSPGNPIVDVDSSPGSLNVGVSELLTLDASDSVDPEGEMLSFGWQGPAGDAYAISPRPGAPYLADVSFNQPGLYMFSLTATDAAGNATTVEREAAVYGAGGFSGFNNGLESYWTSSNAPLSTPSFQPGSYTLNDRGGHLTMNIQSDEAKPLTASNPNFPWMQRPLPISTDWSLHGKLQLESLQLGSFQTGILAETTADGGSSHYAVGMFNGTELVAVEIDTSGAVSILEMISWDENDATVRLRRAGDQLHFEYRKDKVWLPLHMQTLAAGAEAVHGGPYIATDAPHNVRVAFDYVLLVDPGTVSSLQKDLRLTEIMYNPTGGQDLEYLEIHNIGTLSLDLAGAHFTNGIDYTFGEVQLGAGKTIIVAKDNDAFKAEYGADINMAAGSYGGQLANGGETLTLVDAQERLIFSITYNDGGDWPSEADGRGSSIELVSASEPINSPINWKASAEGGSPGEVNLGGGGGEPQPGDADGDGIADAWETQFGLDPADADDASTDSDGDGWTALEEYYANTDPNDDDDFLSLTVMPVSNTEVSFSFTLAPDRVYAFERSATMTGVWSAMTTFGPEATGRAVSNTQAVPDFEKGFYRLRVSP